MKLLDEDARRLAGAWIAGAALGWWPAFTLGVYGVVFFDQLLALWAAATSAFLALGVRPRHPRLTARRAPARRSAEGAPSPAR